MKKPTLYLLGMLCLCSTGWAHEHAAKTGGVQSLDVYAADGRQYLLTGETVPDQIEARIFLRVSTDDGAHWSEPVRVNAGNPAPFGLSRGNDAQVAAHGDRLVAVWTTAGTDQWGTGQMATALSGDGGKTWKPGPNPADDGLTSGHGFIDIASDAQGVFHLVWLDHRSGKQGVYHASSADGGSHWSANRTVDSETCECCWNVVTTDAAGHVFTLYRDAHPRDMSLAASQDGGKSWSRPTAPAAFDWQIDACPHIGGALVARGGKLHALVATGKEGAAGLYYVATPDEGHTWSTPRRLGETEARHGDLAANGSAIAAIWDRPGADGPGISAAIMSAENDRWIPARMEQSGSLASHPRLLPAHDGFRAFWTEQGEHGNVWRSAFLKADE